MKKIMLPILLFAQLGNSQNRSELPFENIGDYPKEYTARTVMIRLISGLGYRYHWASKELRPIDLAYRPSSEAASAEETLMHLYGLSDMIKNAVLNQPSLRPLPKTARTYTELREATLTNLKEAIQGLQLSEEEGLAARKVILERVSKRVEFPFWHAINGPVSDALYHVGQLVSFRRTTGNPIDSNVSVFMGKNKN